MKGSDVMLAELHEYHDYICRVWISCYTIGLVAHVHETAASTHPGLCHNIQACKRAYPLYCSPTVIGLTKTDLTPYAIQKIA